ncbi:unnamed protein product [Urochloa humidicola]
MEVSESEDEGESSKHVEDEEMFTLPNEWTYSEEDQQHKQMEVENRVQQDEKPEQNLGEVQEEDDSQDDQEQIVEKKEGRKGTTKKKWGPVVAVRRSKRNAGDNRPALERAQAAKAKRNEEWTLEEYAGSLVKNPGNAAEVATSVPSGQKGRVESLYDQPKAGSLSTREITLSLKLYKAEHKKAKTQHYAKTEPLNMGDWLQQMYNLEAELETYIPSST